MGLHVDNYVAKHQSEEAATNGTEGSEDALRIIGFTTPIGVTV